MMCSLNYFKIIELLSENKRNTIYLFLLFWVHNTLRSPKLWAVRFNGSR